MGPALAGGEVVKTFPNEADHVKFVGRDGSSPDQGPALRRPGPGGRPAHRRVGRHALLRRPAHRGRAHGRRPVRTRRALKSGRMADHDVLVVGGGPSGAACAYWLAEAGHDVRRRREEALPPGEDLRRRADPPGGQAARRHGPGRRPGRATTASTACGRSPSAGPSSCEWPERARLPPPRLRRHPPRPRPAGGRAGGEGGRHRLAGHGGRRARSSTTGIARGAVVKNKDTGDDHRGPGPLHGGRRRGQLPLRPGPRHAPATGPTPWAWPSGATSRRPATTSRGSSPTSTSATRPGNVLPGYGWIFPLGDGRVNVGVGLLSTFNQWKEVNTTKLMDAFVDYAPASWGISPETSLRAAHRRASCPWACRSGRRSGPTWLGHRRRRRRHQPVQRRGHRLRLRDRAHGGRAPSTRRSTPADGLALRTYEDRLQAEYDLYFKVARAFVKIIGRPDADAGAGRHRDALAARSWSGCCGSWPTCCGPTSWARPRPPTGRSPPSPGWRRPGSRLAVIDVPRARFEELVADALDSIPEALGRHDGQRLGGGGGAVAGRRPARPLRGRAADRAGRLRRAWCCPTASRSTGARSARCATPRTRWSRRCGTP